MLLKVARGARYGAVVRALASHQCGPVSHPGVDAICGLSYCGFSPFLREVFLRVLRFSPLLKNQHFQIPIRSGTHGHVSTSEFVRTAKRSVVNKLQKKKTHTRIKIIIIRKRQSTIVRLRDCTIARLCIAQIKYKDVLANCVLPNCVYLQRRGLFEKR